MIGLLFLTSCTRNYPKELGHTLKIAGKNKQELLKVYYHYLDSEDSQKLKAALFLIENMYNKYGYCPAHIEGYYPLLDQLNKQKTDPLLKNKIPETINYWLKTNNEFLVSNSWQNDAEIIRADLLIEDIDYAFKVWKEMPWAQSLNFDQFCQWILPYRVLNEPVSRWRKYYYEKYAWIRDSVGNECEPQKVTEFLNRILSREFEFEKKFDAVPMLSAIDMDKYRMGICEHRYIWVISIMRSIGIPVSIDFTPQFTKRPKSHSWVVVLDTANTIYPINAGDIGDKAVYATKEWPATKVFRNSYRINSTSQNLKQELARYPHQSFIDVSNQYNYNQTNISLNSNPHIKKNTPIYLYCIGYSNPVDITLFDGKECKWNNLACDAVYLAVYKKNNQLIPISQPFTYYSDDPQLKVEFKPDLQNKETAVLSRKYPPVSGSRLVKYADAMVGGTFEASNKPDFSDAVQLFTISNAPYSFKEKEISTNTLYRYLRFIPKSNHAIHIAEIGFYKEEGDGSFTKLKGKIMNNTPSPCFSHKINYLENNTRYYWKIEEKQNNNSIRNGKICSFTTGNNIAQKAIISSSSEYNSVFSCAKVADNMIGENDNGRWISKPDTAHFIRLDWKNKQTINRVVIYDKTYQNDHTANGVLSFSDGSQIEVHKIPEDGNAKIIDFPTKKTSFIEFSIKTKRKSQTGISEIEVFSPDKNNPKNSYPNTVFHNSSKQTNLSSQINLTWPVRYNDESYDIYFGKSLPPVLLCSVQGIKKQLEKAFDNDVKTNCDLPAGYWIGIDLEVPETISKIEYLPRNDLNMIEIGDEYELFYFDNGFRSLGRKIAHSHTLQYENVPSNSVLLLRDLTKGKEEGMFLYNNNKQNWL